MFVAEVGLNHLGDPDYALEYVDALARTSADAVSFQIREPAFYQQAGIDFEDMGAEVYGEARRRLRSAGKQFGVALADPDGIDRCEDLGVGFYKVLSWDIRNHDFLSRLLERTDRPLYVSTGTSGMEEIDSFAQEYRAFHRRISLIHTQLSHSIDDVNLSALGNMRERFGLPVGFGSHCSDPVVIFGAAVLGASDIFVYVRGARPVRHPDHEHAVPLSDLEAYASGTKVLMRALGTPVKQQTAGNPIEEAYVAKRLGRD